MKLFRTYSTLLLALLITVSASGVSISLHRCCGSIVDFSLFGNAKECKMAERERFTCSSKKSERQRQVCCSTQNISIKSSSETRISKRVEIGTKQIKEVFDVLFFYTLYKNIFREDTTSAETENTSPGLVFSETILLLLKQFRI